MINLYEKLGITPNASKEEIENAIKSAAQKKALPLEILQQAKNYLLNPNMKKKYDAKLFAEHPEILQSIIAPSELKYPREKKPKKMLKTRKLESTVQKYTLSNYITSNIDETENILYIAKVSYWSQIGLILLGILFFISGIMIEEKESALIFYLLWIINWAKAIINVTSTELAITEKRVIAKFGFIKRLAIELRFNKIESLVILQSITGRIFNYGTIFLRGTGGSTAPIPYIVAPLSFKRLINEILDEIEEY